MEGNGHDPFISVRQQDVQSLDHVIKLFRRQP